MTRQPQTRAVSQLFQWIPRTALAVLPAFAGLGGLAIAAGGMSGGSDDVPGPHKAPVDEFHPAKGVGSEKAYGGEVVVHLSSMVEGLNQAVENSAVARWIRYEVHDQLVLQDWEMWDYRPSLAEGVDSEDQLILKPEAASKYTEAKVVGTEDKARHIIYGTVQESGGVYTVTGKSKGTMLGQGKSTTVSKDDVVSLEKGTVFTYYLPGNCDWHDGHRFNADDVLFSWEIFGNMTVDADEVRFQYEQILAGRGRRSDDRALCLREAILQGARRPRIDVHLAASPLRSE